MYPVAILAGGLATRIKPISKNLPKSLVPINNIPFIDLQLNLLSHSGFTEIKLLVGHLGEKIESHVGDGKKFGISVTYAYDGTNQLGTGGALYRALPLLGDTFCVLYGDSYLKMNFAEAVNKFQNSRRLGLMSIFRNFDQNHQNNVDFDGKKFVRYSKINPPPMANYIDHGFSILRRESFETFDESDQFDLSSVFEKLANEDQLEVYEALETFYEIGSFEGIKALESKLREKN
jgi:MurNAc alpha-1-phosphate uridylyltransferase